MRAALVAFAAALAAVPAPASATVAPSYVGTVASTYVPGDVTVFRGGSLTLVNLENIAHDIAASDTGPNGLPLFKSSVILGVGTTAKVNGVAALDQGIYPFYCSIHEFMRGTVTIT